VSSRGRPTLFTPELAADICLRLAEGESLRAICRDEDMPSDFTVRSWALEDREGFSSHYEKARKIQAFKMFEEMLEIADDGTNDWMVRDGKLEFYSENVARSRLRTDTRKWMLSKMLPKIYGDRIATQQLDEHGNPAKAEQVFRWKREDEP